MAVVLCMLMGYLTGCLNPAYFFSKRRGFDIKKTGSGNAGASNAIITMGKAIGVFTMIFDILKCVIITKLAVVMFPTFGYAAEVAGVFCVLGHIFPFEMGFRGGKGLACLGGIILSYNPLIFLIMLLCEIVLALIVDYICIVPITGSLAFAAVYYYRTKKLIGALLYLAMALVIFYRHIQNIVRIVQGKEARFSFLWNKKEVQRLKDRYRKESDKDDRAIKVVLWDIDGTLLNFLEAEKRAIRKCFSSFGLGKCSDEMLQEYSSINKGYWEKMERGEISKKEVLEGRFEEFFAKEDLTCDAEAFNNEYQERLGDTISFYENALEVVQNLRGKVLQFAVTNGTVTAQKKKLKSSGLDKVMDGIFISDEIGYEKPCKEFFDAVWKGIEDLMGEVSKDQVMIVGDSLTSDMQGGCNEGIRCCWYNRDGKENTKPELHIDYEIDDLMEVAEIVDAPAEVESAPSLS